MVAGAQEIEGGELWSSGEELAPSRRTENGLRGSRVATRLPAQDLDRARRFYAEKLGLEPDEERPGGLRYQCREGWFALFESSGRPSGAHTQIAFEVTTWHTRCVNCAPAVWCSRSTTHLDSHLGRQCDGRRELSLERASGERAAWFRDSEGNLVGLGQPIG
jgi:catechol 2,3-dioxygenase-like lactoylglutathione lyase family enzyme